MMRNRDVRVEPWGDQTYNAVCAVSGRGQQLYVGLSDKSNAVSEGGYLGYWSVGVDLGLGWRMVWRGGLWGWVVGGGLCRTWWEGAGFQSSCGIGHQGGRIRQPRVNLSAFARPRVWGRFDGFYCTVSISGYNHRRYSVHSSIGVRIRIIDRQRMKGFWNVRRQNFRPVPSVPSRFGSDLLVQTIQCDLTRPRLKNIAMQ